MGSLAITSEIGFGAMSDNDGEMMWQVYTEAFADSSTKCAQQQICHTHDDFIAATKDSEYLKVVARHSDSIVGFVLLTNNLDKASITNCSPDFFRNAFPDHVTRRELYYVTSLAVKPRYQANTPCFIRLCERLTEFVDENDRMLAGDFTQNSTPWLAEALKKAGEASQQLHGLIHDGIDVQIVDVQSYFTLRVTKS